MSKKFEIKTIDDATAAELRDYALAFLGIPVDGLSDEQVRAKVKAANEDDRIYVRPKAEREAPIGAPPPPVMEEASGSRAVGSLGHDDPKVLLTLHAEERDGVVVSRHKEIGVNGRFWLVKRGEPVEVPYRVYEALNNAVRDNVTHTEDGTVVRSRVHNTPFNVHRMPSQEEIAAWHERNSQTFMA